MQGVGEALSLGQTRCDERLLKSNTLEKLGFDVIGASIQVVIDSEANEETLKAGR